MNFSCAYSLKNNEVSLDNCDREPVHIPGCIQSFGVLLAVDPKTFQVLQVSDNSLIWLGKTAEQLQGSALIDIIQEVNFGYLLEHIEENKLDLFPRYVFTLEISNQSLDFLAHFHDQLLILEAEQTSAVPQEKLFKEVNCITAKLLKENSLKKFCQTLALEIRNLTGLDRVMVYKFHKDYSGEVFAEAKHHNLHSYLNLRYPAEDIPNPAREIFKKIWVRPVPDVNYTQSEMVPLINPLTQRPLDMTYAFLRGASVMYTDYLKNMSVAMSLTLSIVVDGKLWGLVACHHNTPKIVPWPIRAACELLAQMSSLQLKNTLKAEFKLYERDVENKISGLTEKIIVKNQQLSNFIHDKSLKYFVEASGIAILEDKQWYVSGLTPSSTQLNQLLNYLKSNIKDSKTNTSLWATECLSEAYADALQYAKSASGILVMPLSINHDHLIIWFRQELVQTVNWAGDPYNKPIEKSPHGPRLLPRTSFSLWQESVKYRSESWEDVEIEAIKRLRQALTEAIASQSHTLKKLNDKLAKSNNELESFAYLASHDLQEPLRGIYFYAHLLREQAEENQDQEALQRLDSLMKLTQRMKSLIESLLDFSKLGHTNLAFEKINMNNIIEEALDQIAARIDEKRPQIKIDQSLPYAYGDGILLREVWANLISNAIKYNDHEKIKIEIGYLPTPYGQSYFIRDNGIGIAPQHHDLIFQVFKRLHSERKYYRGSGVGLSIVKRVIERHQGKIWIESNLGQGTTIYFTLKQKPVDL